MLKGWVTSCRHAVQRDECTERVGSATSPHTKPVLLKGLGAIYLRVPGLGGEAVACMVDHCMAAGDDLYRSSPPFPSDSDQTEAEVQTRSRRGSDLERLTSLKCCPNWPNDIAVAIFFAVIACSPWIACAEQ